MNDLIYDVGLHRGEDTGYYLKLGYRVVAFEANPDLVEACGARFADAIADGRLRIVAGAIAEPGATGTITFYKNAKSVWGTTSREWAERNAKLLARSTAITVPVVDFAEALERHGTPRFIKIDVEGVDELVVDTICRLPEPPAFMSMESEKVDFDRLVATIDKLQAAGYRRFNIVQQAGIPGTTVTAPTADGAGRVTHRFERHASGVFGDDLTTPWVSRDEAVERYRSIFRGYRLLGDGSFMGRWGRVATKPWEKLLGIGLPGWHDLHARRD